MNDAVSKNAFLGDMPIPKLLVRISMPSIIALLVSGLYNVIDAIFLGQYVGKYAIGAIAVVYPFQLFRIALGVMIGAGAASIISRTFGAGDVKRANRCAGAAFFIGAVSGALVTVGVWGCADGMLYLFGGSPKIVGYAREYLLIILVNTIVLIPCISSFDLMRAQGRAEQVMKLGLIGAALNIGLDAILIAGLKMGVKGAAWATVASQCVVFVLAIGFFLSKKNALEIRWRHFLPERALIQRILALGAPVFTRLAGVSLVMIVINNALRMYGGDSADLAISAYGVISRIAEFTMLPIFGLMQGLQPVVGFNFGAGKIERSKKALKLAVAVSVLYGITVFIIGAAASKSIVRLFNTDPALVEMASSGLLLVLLVFIITGVCMMGSAFFQAIGKALPSLLLFLARQALFLFPLVLLLPRYFGIYGTWAAIPIADLLAAVLTIVCLAREFRKPPWKTVGEPGAPIGKSRPASPPATDKSQS